MNTPHWSAKIRYLKQINQIKRQQNRLDPHKAAPNPSGMIDARTPEDFQHLPKFIIGEDNNPDELAARDFVIHCHYPRFIIEFTEGDSAPTFIDDQVQFIASELKAGRDPGTSMATLLREAGDFYDDGGHDDSRN